MDMARSKTLGFVLLGLGGFFLIGQVFDISDLTWPLFVLAPGLLLFLGMILGGKKVSGLAIPASIITMIGTILFTQNLTNRFESWAYAWALILVAVGVGLIVQKAWANQSNNYQAGLRLVTLGLILFASFGAFFELFVFADWADSVLGRYLIPVGLIAAGVLFLQRLPQIKQYE